MWVPITVVVSGSGIDLHVEARDGATVDDLAEAVAAHVGAPRDARLHGPAGPMDPHATLAAAGLRAGATVHLGHPPATEPAPARRVLRVVAGPDAGLSASLPEQGTLTVGRAPHEDIVLSGTAVSSHHAIVACTRERVTLTDDESRNGCAVDDRRITGPHELGPASVIQIGDDLLVVHEARPVRQATLTPLPDGTLRLDRQHRYAEPAAVAVVDLPAAPPDTPRAGAGLNWSAGSGLVLGVVAYVVWHNVAFLLLSGASTATLLVSGIIGLVRARRRKGKEGSRYARERTEALARLSTVVADERAALLRASPDLAALLEVACRHDARLWERRPEHADFLHLRVGVADLPSAVTVNDPSDPPTARPVLTRVPVTVPLGALGTIGIVGDRARARGLARALVAQAVVQSGPADLRVVLLSRSSAVEVAEAWNWLRWLPHARTDGVLATVGADDATLRQQVDALAAVVATGGRAGPRFLVVLDDVVENDVQGLPDVLRAGPDGGICVVALGALPYRCPVTATFHDDNVRLTLLRAGGKPLEDVLADQVSPAYATRLGRALAPLSDPDSRAGAAGLPAQVSLLDHVVVDPAALAQRWQEEPRRTRVVLGATGDGPLLVDLVANGPHALIAGATGWGKSALLQTLIGSLALANRPDQLGFILVDFKGGAAFGPFEKLPHVMDMITNLDGPKVVRALDSLQGEIHRRQQLLAGAGIEKLEEYQRRADAGTLPPGCPPALPRMFIVIDEFSILREALPPDILSRLVTVATQGRSIGLHLVIGTQTPRGIVPNEIRPNVNLRVALHLDADHSQDVVGSPAAQQLTVRGRALLRGSEDNDVTVFQSAYVGGRTRRTTTPVRLTQAPFEALGRPPASLGVLDVQDVDVLVRAITDTALAGGLAGPALPWLPPLPSTVELPPSANLALAYGYEDQPEQRRQPVAAWDLRTGTHLLVGGRPRSGRTTLLRALAASVAAHRPDELHLYVMDCGGGLADLADLPHCGAYVTAGEYDRGARLLGRLDELVMSGRAPARTVLLIDDFDTWLETFGELDNGALVSVLTRVFNRGATAGVHVAVTGSSRLLSRHAALNEAAQDRLALPFDFDDYGSVNVPVSARPLDPGPGHAVRLQKPFRTVQVAVVLPPPPAHPIVHDGPWRIDALPTTLTYPAARTLPRAPGTDLAFGAGGDRLGLVGASLAEEGPGFFVAGESRSGRSTALLSLGLDLLAHGTRLVVLTTVRTSPLRFLDTVEGVVVVLNTPDMSYRLVQLALAAAPTDDFVVLVDDADRVANADIARLMRQQIFDVDRPGVGAVVAGQLESFGNPGAGTLLGDAGRAGTGLLTTPRTHRPYLFGTTTKLPEAYTTGEVTGRSIVVRRRGLTPVQVPHATAEDAAALPHRRGRMPRLLELVNTLAGPSAVPVERLRELIHDLDGFHDLPPDAAERAQEAARTWAGAPAELLRAVT